MKTKNGKKDMFWAILIAGLITVSVLAWFLGRWGGSKLVNRQNGVASQNAEDAYSLETSETSAEERASRIGRIERMEGPAIPDSGTRRREKSETQVTVSTDTTTSETAAVPGVDEGGEESLLVEDTADQKEEAAPEPPKATDDETASHPPSSDAPIYRLQVGMFASRENAASVKSDLEQNYQIPVFIAEVDLDGQKKFRVQAGAFKNRENAEKIARELRIKGYQTYLWQDE